ncbi:hypothetical protein E4P39_05260 [Blastococcus sp. CT_GayMR19]|uniref:hypothetical protein n=1 Tax=Blastococcus sp. CT_GayMR19 TaxID=2559608 RepID=UPI001073F1AE|nr:hypothetical protein [Blastococcus sp. CT_GayMR19]TFV77394.1 hypothetical protein E4P39_05260 [Blastococcus sp. CT_GayMR19]
MATLRIDLEVQDYHLWRTAFGKDAGGRGRHGARRHRIFQAAGDECRVSLDIDFSTMAEAERFLTVLRDEVWPSPDKAPAKIGAPAARIIEMVEAEDYR